MEPAQIIEKIRAKYPDGVLKTGEYGGQFSVSLKKEMLLPLCRYLHDDPELSMDFLKDLCGVDYLGKRDMRFEVVYHLYSMRHNHLLRVKVPVSEMECSVDSVTPVWRGADWHERECFDMYGIEFKGHPDLRRILLPEDWKGHPQRKDYPTQGPEEEWPGFTAVLKKTEEYKKYEWNR